MLGNDANLGSRKGGDYKSPVVHKLCRGIAKAVQGVCTGAAQGVQFMLVPSDRVQGRGMYDASNDDFVRLTWQETPDDGCFGFCPAIRPPLAPPLRIPASVRLPTALPR